MKESLVLRIKSHSGLRRFAIAAHDIVLTVAAFPISVLLRDNFNLSQNHVQPVIIGSAIILVTSFFLFRITGLHRSMWRYTSPRDLLKILQAIILVIVLFVPLMLPLGQLDDIPLSALVIFGLLAFTCLSGSRIIYGCYKTPNVGSLKRHASKETVRVLIAGNVRSTAVIAQAIHAQYGDFVQIVGVIGRRADVGRFYHGMAVLGSIADLGQVLTTLDVQGMSPHQIVVSQPEIEERPGALESLKSQADTNNIKLVSSSNLHQVDVVSRVNITCRQHIDDSSTSTSYQMLKRCFDFCTAIIALIALSPLLVLVVWISWITIGSPIFFRQIRTGRHLREFSLIKFRTMRQPFGPSGQLLSDAERVSWFGRLLRATRLDEIPQLWNILVGDMALIGPRPLHARDLSIDYPTLRKRHSVLPGLTGWAQVNGGQLLSSDQKMMLDLHYIDTISPLRDVRILVMTIRTVLFGEYINYTAIEDAKKADKGLVSVSETTWDVNKQPLLTD